jgi:hypothetical protein
MSLPSLPDGAARQLELLSNQLEELKPYLLSPELFWPLGGRINETPRLTLGNLLLNLRAIQAGESTLEPALRARFSQLRINWEVSQTKWPEALSSKALQEMSARLNLWRGYLGDLSEGLGNRLNYRTEVRNRVLFELLVPYAGQNEPFTELIDAMHGLDVRFSTMSVQSPFVWDDAYSKAFPQDQFGMLYREPIVQS